MRALMDFPDSLTREGVNFWSQVKLLPGGAYDSQLSLDAQLLSTSPGHHAVLYNTIASVNDGSPWRPFIFENSPCTLPLVEPSSPLLESSLSSTWSQPLRVFPMCLRCPCVLWTPWKKWFFEALFTWCLWGMFENSTPTFSSCHRSLHFSL